MGPDPLRSGDTPGANIDCEFCVRQHRRSSSQGSHELKAVHSHRVQRPGVTAPGFCDLQAPVLPYGPLGVSRAPSLLAFYLLMPLPLGAIAPCRRSLIDRP